MSVVNNVLENLNADMPTETFDMRLSHISHGFYNLELILFVLNIILYIICEKQIKRAKWPFIIMLIAMFISFICKLITELAGNIAGEPATDYTPEYIIIIFCSIIQLFVFIKLIIDIIRKNKKKEENQSCQE